MKVLILASVFTAAMVPFAAAAETDAACQTEEDRRVPQVRINTDAPGGSTPAPTARQTSTARETEAQVAQREAAEAARAFAERRRSGKRIPDAELIGPRGAL